MSLSMFGLARVGRDVEVRNTPSGDSVANVSLAFNVRVKNEKATQWVDGVLWGKRADALAQYLTKGTAVSVLLGDVNIETFTKGDGTVSSKLVGRIVEIDLAGGGQATQAPPPPAPRPPPPPPRPAPAAHGFDDMDDDIPF